MTLLHEIEWQAPLIEPYRDPDAEALMRKKYGFVMDSVAFYSRRGSSARRCASTSSAMSWCMSTSIWPRSSAWWSGRTTLAVAVPPLLMLFERLLLRVLTGEIPSPKQHDFPSSHRLSSGSGAYGRHLPRNWRR
jgi:hypothetical protein